MFSGVYDFKVIMKYEDKCLHFEKQIFSSSLNERKHTRKKYTQHTMHNIYWDERISFCSLLVVFEKKCSPTVLNR